MVHSTILILPRTIGQVKRGFHFWREGFWARLNFITIEPRHEISNNMVCVTRKASDQPAHKRSLIRAFASGLNILRVFSYWVNIICSFLAQKGAAQPRLSLHLLKYHIVGNHMTWLNYLFLFFHASFVWCALESSQGDSSIVYPQHMFTRRNKKI